MSKTFYHIQRSELQALLVGGPDENAFCSGVSSDKSPRKIFLSFLASRIHVRILGIAFCILSSLSIVPLLEAQSTTVSGNVVDGGGQTWNNGTYTFQLVANPNFPNLAQYTWTGGTLNQVISGTLNGSGAYSQSVPSNTAISPQGSKWQLTVCPKATFSCFAAPNTTISGATQTLNATPPVIAISLINPINTLAYSDSEIVSAIVGSMYYNLTTQQERICQVVVIQSCTTWVNIGAGAGGGTVTSISATSPIVATPNPITGVGNISCPTCAVGTTPVPGGANTNVQYNDGGVFGGDANLTWNKTTRSITVSGAASSVQSITAGAGGNALVLTSSAASLSALDAGSVGSLQADSDVLLNSVNGKVKFGSIGTVSGQATFLGKTSGSAEVGVADVAGTPNRINLPTTTGTSGQVLSTNGANPQQLSWVANGTGTVTPATQFSFPFYSAAGIATTLSGVAGATSPNGVPQYLISIPSGGVATTPTLALAGTPVRANTTTSDTIAATDRSSIVTESNVGAVAVSLPQAGSAGFTNNFTHAELNINSGLVTITPTTSTINGNATQIVPFRWGSYIYSDNTNYRALTVPDIAAYPNCIDSAGNHLNFTAATGAFSCGTSSSGAGTTINPTNNVLPKRSNATTFVDSALTDDGTSVTTSVRLLPSGDQTLNLGIASQEWQNVYTIAVGSGGANDLILFTNNSGTLAWRLRQGTGTLMGGPNVLGFGATLGGTIDAGISRDAAKIIDIGAGTAGNTTGGLKGSYFQSAGTKFTASGCSNSTTVGGATVGTFTSGTTGACTVTVTMGDSDTATNGWACFASNRTTPANIYDQTSSTTTTATFSGTTVTGDVISFGCLGY